MPDTASAPQPHAHAEGLRSAFRERRISFRTMDRPLRIATALTVAGLLAAAILIWLRGVDAPRISLGVVSGSQVTLALPLFVATLVLLSAGFGFLVAGALFARRVVAIVGLVCLTALIGWATGILGIGGYAIVLPDWANWASRIVLAVIWIVAAGTLLVRRGQHGDASEHRRLRIAVMSAVTVLFCCYFLILWVASPVINGLTLFPQSVSLLMADVAILSTPMLMIAAIDFGEWGEFAAQRLARLAVLERANRRKRILRFLVPAVLGTGAIVYGILMARGTAVDRLWQVAEALILVAVALAILLAIGRIRRISRATWPTTLGFAAVFCVCAIVTWGGGTSVAAVSGALTAPPPPAVSAQGNYTQTANVRSISGISGYTALVPVGWGVKSDHTSGIDTISDRLADGTAVEMLGLSVNPGTSMAKLVDIVSATADGRPSVDGTWQKQLVTPTGGGEGAIWMRDTATGVQVFYGVAAGKSAHSGLTTLEAIVRTVRLPGHAAATLASVLAANGAETAATTATQRSDDTVQVLGAGFALLTGIIALLALLLFGRRWSPGWRLAVLFYGTVATITLVAASSSIGRLLFGPGATWPVLTFGGLVAAAGLGGLIAVAVAARSRSAWAKRIPAAVAGILGAVIVLGAIHQLYDFALSAEEVPQWAAILILVAVGWDILMSGEAMTNLASFTFPRSSRVVAFYGYTLVLAAAMVFYSGQLSVATGHEAESFFNPESTTQSALFRIAFPLLLLFFLLRVAGRSNEPAPERAATSVTGM